MALHRGIQSAIFYYLSCAPCTGYSYRKKRRKEAIKDRAQKQQMEMDDPGLYRHPSPFATNPHWQTEIDLGPTPLPTRNKKTSQKKSRTGNESTLASYTSLPLARPDTDDGSWKVRKHQREDEDLWGSNASRTSILGGSVINGKGIISRPPTARTARTDKTGTSYYSVNNPPINDLHPAIVTRLENKEDAMWMLQPPPSARVMSGRDPPPTRRRRGSDSASSRMSSRRGDASPLSRQMSQRIIDEKLRSRELLPAINMDNDQDHDPRPSISPSKSTADLSTDGSTRARRRPRPPPINVSEDTSASSVTLIHRPHVPFDPELDDDNAGNLHPSRAVDTNKTSRRSARNSPSPSRMRGPRDRRTIANDSSENRTANKRPALSANNRQDSSLNVLQELVPSSLFNVRRPTKAPSFEARIELPSPTNDEVELLGSGKAAFENWYETREFAAFPEWVSERTKREVSSRWSVDF